MLNRIAIILALIAAIALLTIPVVAAPAAQTTLPNFTLNAQTVVSITVAITDGHVIVVPVDLTFIAQNQEGETDVSVIADVEQQAGIFIGVAPSGVTSATMQVPLTAAQATATASANQTEQTDATGTHVANRNSNLRAGPGTNFDIVGRVAAGGTVTVVGENEDGTWLELDNGNWIAEFLVDAVEADTIETDDNDNTDNTDEEESETDPDATATPNPTDTAPDQAALPDYLQQLASIGAESSDAVNSLTDLIQNAEPLTAAWRNDVAAQLAVLSDALDQYLALIPVPGYEDLHAQVTDVTFACEQAVDYLVSGLENPSTIDQSLATQSVQACAAQTATLANEVETLQ
jgi:hypothetical protein